MREPVSGSGDTGHPRLEELRGSYVSALLSSQKAIKSHADIAAGVCVCGTSGYTQAIFMLESLSTKKLKQQQHSPQYSQHKPAWDARKLAA